MATIQASIKLHDGMTPALKSMQNALNIVINSFESMQRATDKGVSTNAIKAARAELSKTGAYFNRIEKEINENTAAQNRFNRSVKGGTSVVGGLATKIGGLVAAYAGIHSIGAIVNTADNLTQTTARLNMVNDGLQTTKELEDKIYQSAMRSRAGFMETADAVAKLGLRAGDIFKSNDETIQFAETLNKMFVIAGASQAEMSAATLQLTQALGSGVLRGEEFNAVFEAAPNVMKAVADSMGVPIGQLRNLAAEGKISADIVKNALLNATEDVNRQFESMPMTWAQVWTSIKNFTITATRPILQAISDITKSERFIGFMNSAKNAMTIVARVLGVVFSAVQRVCAFIYDAWAYIEPILIAAAIVYLPSIIASLWAMVTPLLISAAAWLAMNWPILLVIAAVAALIMLARYMGITFSDVCGFVAGLIMWLGAIIWNVIKFVWNVIVTVVGIIVITIWNALTFIANMAWGVCQWIANAWNWCGENISTVFYNIGVWWDNLWIDARVGFYSFINDVLSKLSALAQKIQPLAELFDVDLSGMISGAQATLNTKISNLESGRKQAKAYTAMQKTDWGTFDYTPYESNISKYTAGYTDLNDSFYKGYSWGSGVGEQVENFFSGKNYKDISGTQQYEDLLKQYGLGNVDKYGNVLNGAGGPGSGAGGGNGLLDKIAANTKDIAGNTSDIATSEKDLDLMRDLAEQEAINRYTMTDLKIQMTNNNSINSNMDLDKVVDYLQEKVYEGVLATAEGVHF